MRDTQHEQELFQLFKTNLDQWEPSQSGDLRAFYNLYTAGKVRFEEIVRVSQGMKYIRPRCVHKNKGNFL